MRRRRLEVAPGPIRNLLIFLLLWAARAGAQEVTAEVTRAVGGVAFLSPIPQNPEEYSQIHWRYNNTRKIASRTRGGSAEYPNSSYRGRVELFRNYTLKISPLKIQDGGEYWVYLEDDSGKERIQRVLLTVHAPVPKPQVTAEVEDDDPQSCKATLRCFVALEGVTYEWIPPQKLGMKGGSVQRVSFNPSVETYVCKVTNAVSSNNASLTYRHPCTWTEGSVSAASRPTPGAWVALGFLVLLFLLLPAA